MAANIMMRNLGKTMAYLGVVIQIWLAARKPIAGNMIYAAHIACVLLWGSGILLFKKNLESK